MERTDTLAWSMIPGAIRYDTIKVQTSPRDRMAETMGDIDELYHELRGLFLRRATEEERILGLCRACGDLTDVERDVIVYRYVYRAKWEQISGYLNLRERRPFQIHQSACDKLAAFLWPVIVMPVG